ncbi:MAG: hypothetical protein H7301_05025 [Cryobacterium sp.]|nr:hypothetical protein [Oligoflexia bacterium]
MAKKSRPELRLGIWKRTSRGTYVVARADLLTAIEKSGFSHEQIASRMGASLHHLNESLDGMEITVWSAMFIEWSLTPDTRVNRMRDF